MVLVLTYFFRSIAFLFCFSFVGNTLLAGVSSKDSVDPLDLLKHSDRSRGAAAVKRGVEWDIELTSVEKGTTTHMKHRLSAKGDDALAVALEPARSKGDRTLFNGRVIWFFKTGGGQRKPVSLSPRQRLSGQAATGDIASTNYFRDYAPTLAGDDKVDGTDTWKLELQAKEKNVTYDKITYWVSKKDKLGVKADFKTVSNQVFKTAYFDYKQSIEDGKESYPFVSRMKIIDALNPSNITEILYTKPRVKDFPDSLFKVQNLAR